MIILPLDDSDKLTGIVLEHDGQEIRSVGSIFDRTPFPSTGELFIDINGFWATLPKEKQDNIWNTYVEIEQTFYSVNNDIRMHDRLVALVGQLYSNFSMAELRTWIRVYGNVVIPPEVQDSMGEYTSQERTYLKDDYFGLIVMVVMLRPMIPIWNQYTREAKQTNGTSFKEYTALGLLNKTEIIGSPEFAQLRTYVHHNVDPSKITLSAIVHGVGTAELGDWVFSVALIRKVCVGVIMHHTPRGLMSNYSTSANIVSNVYKQVESTLNALDRRFDGRIRKKPESMGAVDDDKASNAEKIIVKQPINDYKFILAGQYAKFISGAHGVIDATIPSSMVDACIKRLKSDSNFAPVDMQIALTQWACHAAISARLIPSLEHNERVHVMGLAQALYWHWNFPDLALLLTAHPIHLDEQHTFGNETRSRVTNEQLRVLREQYPYYQRRTNKLEQQRTENVAMEAIDCIYDMMEGKAWDLAAPAALLEKTTMRPYSAGGWLIPSDIKVQLAEFIIRLNKHKYGV